MKAGLLRSALSSIAIAALVVGAGATAAQGAERPAFATGPGTALLSPAFGWDRRDYAVRCDGQSLEVSVTGASGWTSRVEAGRFRSGSYEVSRRLAHNEALTVGFRNRAGKSRTYHLRCLPEDFPEYSFERDRPGGPAFFSLQMDREYAAVFARDGAPVWWLRAGNEPNNVQVLDDGTIAWDPVDPTSFVASAYLVRRLDGRLVRRVTAPGAITDVHELQLLPDGNYLIGGRVIEHHVDASAFGGSADADVWGIEVQEVTPDGRTAWKWDSEGKIDIGESAERWWEGTILPGGEPYDALHWNAAARRGKFVLISFRHLDAVYEINRRTGRIVWKLGGTETPQSLTVSGDSQATYPLGGQHDARLEPDGTISVYDNNTGLGTPPRVTSYRVNAKTGVARLVGSFSDPDVAMSFCCGSARHVPGGNWLVNWGGTGLAGAYDREGGRIFSLQLAVGFSYRTVPVPPGAATARDFRAGMNAMHP